MKKRRVWRYTCDHCKKSNCSSGAMKLHEQRCFRNPLRNCPVCNAQWPLPALEGPMKALESITNESEAGLVDAVRQAVDCCPACMCSAFSQAKLPMVEWETPGEYQFGEWVEGASGEYRYRVNFNYKKERDDYRAEERANWGPGFP